ncbi:secretin N-terminal domain-containing protein [Candidatus Avelusimicrobium fimicolum]|jgi:type IV pilus assembly protein PilQ|uniref:secretin N-terminal domain-containing protein n=1 Tax=Candidatus Avelusimicrobium fimicolum TaxID=3416216 RepID=UPI003D135A1F
MTNRLAVALACVAAVSLGGNAFAQKSRQSLPSDNTIAVTEDTTVKLNGESELYKETEASSPLDRKVSIRVSNVPISAFLNSITTQAKINFIMSEEFANKKVTASLTRVTVREALDTLLRVQGLAYQRIGKSDSYVVTKRSNDAPDTITKIYTLSYISLQGVGSAQSELNSIMPQDVSSSSSSSSSGDSAGLNLGGSSSGSGSDSYSGGAEITTIVKSMLSPVGKIAVDPRTNKLIITDVAEVFPQVENILAELDIKPPQILIEAQIVEVSKTSGLSLGFEYGGSDGAMVSMTGPKRKVDLEYIKGQGVKGWNYIFPSKDQLNSGSSGSGSGSGSGSSSSSSDEGEDKGGLLDFSAFNIVLKSLLTRGEAKYLGKPKVVTLNNKTATITTSTDATVGQTVSQSGSGGGEALTTQSAERKRVGLTLQVTPQVNREGYVTLYVQPSYSDLVSSGFDFSKDTTTRAASTLVRVKNGQTVVIGGLLTSRETDQTRKVPLLGDIPLLGWLFTSKTKSKSTTDLVIFITPTILAE